MLSIVATIGFGSLVLLQGMQGITSFQNAVDFVKVEDNASVQENLVIEHVRFDPSSTDVGIWVRNVGTNEVTVSKITMVKIDTQDLIISDDTISSTIFIKTANEFHPIVLTLPVEDGDDEEWSSQHEIVHNLLS